jgi:HAD superfamily phosphoserine phosphatase-like hydrolase
LRGRTRDDLREPYARFLDSVVLPNLPERAYELVAKEKARSDVLVLSTATNAFLAEPIGRRLGFEHIVATDPEVGHDGRFTGGCVGLPNMRANKVPRLQAWLEARGSRLSDYAESRFYSDSRNDLPLLRAVTHPVAVDPDPDLEAHAVRGGWPILRIRRAQPARRTRCRMRRRTARPRPQDLGPSGCDERPTTQAEIVVIGGGIVGCSVAYHLAKLGHRDVLLLERSKLTSGSTWHAAGLVGQLRTSANITQLLKYSVELYDTLEADTGQATGWKRNGGLRLACNPERLTEIRRQATTAHSFGLEMHLMSAGEARDLWPVMDVSDVLGAAFLPTDGQVNPSDLALALAKGARQRGVTIVEDCPVAAIAANGRRVTGVVTARERSRRHRRQLRRPVGAQVGALAGVNVPLVSVQHQYLVTEPIAGVPRSLPTLRDPDRLIYFKEEVGGW